YLKPNEIPIVPPKTQCAPATQENECFACALHRAIKPASLSFGYLAFVTAARTLLFTDSMQL
ncbi:hypothetical protein NYY88_18535, partial [Acinetobacter baumannii]|nr:hypothetical protein [Acinetobacter baumannii]